MKITKRRIQIVLGLLWLLDGALQLQHQMFTSNFANKVIVPATQGQIGLVSGPSHLAIKILLTHPAVFDAFFASIQLLIGILILNRRTIRPGLILSVIWGLSVWYFGEGLGGLLTWQTTILMGAPGAALLYSIISLAIMPDNKDQDESKELNRPAYWLPIAWAILWIGAAIYQLLPGQNNIADVSSMIYGMSVGAPRWLASLDVHVANAIQDIGHGQTAAQMHMTATQMAAMSVPPNHSGLWFILLLVALQVLIGLLVFFPGLIRRAALGAGMIMSLVFWFIGQSLGSYYSGLATDPNSAPLFIVMAVAILGVTPLPYRELSHRTTQALEKLAI
jgi:hypothetical protein